MAKAFKTVDLFAGPGGLAEGFSSVCDENGNSVYDIVLSVEKEQSAFRTLLLRSFYRQFKGAVPTDYYDFMAGQLPLDELGKRHPHEWASAKSEARNLELGTEEAQAELDPILDDLRSGHHEVVLIGGPPCQAYSLVGRARNKGIKDYDPAKDDRHFLYREYIRILQRLEPAAFVMENVKGILSATIEGHAVFERILRDLQTVSSSNGGYEIVTLLRNKSENCKSYVIRSEDYGIPQKRHRVILVGIRADIATRVTGELLDHELLGAEELTTVSNAIGGMPPLRSGLSKSMDDSDSWHQARIRAFQIAADACAGTCLREVAARLEEYACRIEKDECIPSRTSAVPPIRKNDPLDAWLSDPRLEYLPNHSSRSHMESDLARYAFAAAYSEVLGRSPKSSDFPEALAADHANWKSGKFADRFRVQSWNGPSSTITSHISKDGHYYIHPDPRQCRSLTVREAARLQTFPDNYFFIGNRTQQFVQVGNAVPPLLAHKIGTALFRLLQNSPQEP